MLGMDAVAASPAEGGSFGPAREDLPNHRPPAPVDTGDGPGGGLSTSYAPSPDGPGLRAPVDASGVRLGGLDDLPEAARSRRVSTRLSTPPPLAPGEERIPPSPWLTDSLQGGVQATPLTRGELIGWYAYDWANRGPTVALSVYLPLLLLTLAQQYAWQLVEGGRPPEDCNAVNTADCLQCFEGEGTRLVPGPRYGSGLPLPTLPGGFNPVSYATFMSFLSVGVQAVIFVLVGSWADYQGFRKRLMLIATVCGSCVTMLCLVLYTPSLYWLGGLLLVASNACFGASMVFYNAYLPLLVDATPAVRDARSSGSAKAWMETRDAVENEFSQQGMAAGYCAGAVLTVICLVLSFTLHLSNITFYGICVFLAGAWWLGFSLITFSRLQLRPGPPLPGGGLLGCGTMLATGAANVLATFRKLRRYPQTLRFLLLYFIYSDGYASIALVGVLFGQRDLCMSAQGLVVLSIIVPSGALLGNLVWPRVQARWNIKTKTMIQMHLTIIAILPLYAFIGRWTPPESAGLKHAWELYIFGAIFGLNLGAVQSYSRCMFADLTPHGSEAQMFALYEITDKQSAFFGPFISTVVVQATNSLRVTMIFLLPLLLVPCFLLWALVDHAKGMEDVGRLTLRRAADADATDVLGAADSDAPLEDIPPPPSPGMGLAGGPGSSQTGFGLRATAAEGGAGVGLDADKAGARLWATSGGLGASSTAPPLSMMHAMPSGSDSRPPPAVGQPSLEGAAGSFPPLPAAMDLRPGPLAVPSWSSSSSGVSALPPPPVGPGVSMIRRKTAAPLEGTPPPGPASKAPSWAELPASAAAAAATADRLGSPQATLIGAATFSAAPRAWPTWQSSPRPASFGASPAPLLLPSGEAPSSLWTAGLSPGTQIVVGGARGSQPPPLAQRPAPPPLIPRSTSLETAARWHALPQPAGEGVSAPGGAAGR